MDDRLVTMIMPAWNPRPDWLHTAVRSVLAQRGVQIELIVVDDGCPEPVEPLLADLAEERVRVLRVPHGGPSAARNAGIAAARGDCIRFVDSDDFFPVDSTARLAQLVGADDVIAYGATLMCDAELRPVWKMTARAHDDAATASLLGLFQVRVTSMLFPRAVVERTGEWDPGFPASGDWDFVLRALEHAPVRGDGVVATYYRRHGSSVTADVRAGQTGARRVVARYFERHPEQRGTDLEQRVEARLAAMASRIYFTHGQPRVAISHLRRALATDPRAVAEELSLAPQAIVGKVSYRVRRAIGTA
jgi:hypothetical protein